MPQGGHVRRRRKNVTTSTPLKDLHLDETRPGRSQARVEWVCQQVRAGTYTAPAELVAEALLASSLVGLAPEPSALFWAF
jgi:hypothetical protein